MGGGGHSVCCKCLPRGKGQSPAQVILPAGAGVCIMFSQWLQRGWGDARNRIPSHPPLGCLAPPSQARVILRIFSASPTLVPLGQSPARAEIFLDPGHQAWDQPQEPRGHLKMLCAMETFQHALQLRMHSDPRAVPRFTVTQVTLSSCP